MDQALIQTERLTLRPLTRSDVGLIRLYSQDERLARMTRTIPHPLPPGATEAFVDGVLSGTRGDTVWAIEHRGASGPALIGLVALAEDDEIGYWIGVPFWSTGFATEAVEAVVAHCLGEMRPRLHAQVFQDNPASAQVLTKAGFRYVGEDSVYSIARGATVPVWRYELTRADLAA